MSHLRQGDLFAPSLRDALAARDEACERVAQNAEDHAPGFAERARDFVLSYLTLYPSASVEDVTDAALEAGIRPHDLRAFGPVYLRLSKDGLIVKAGTCARRRGHGTAGAIIWRLADAIQDRP